MYSHLMWFCDNDNVVIDLETCMLFVANWINIVLEAREQIWFHDERGVQDEAVSTSVSEFYVLLCCFSACSV